MLSKIFSKFAEQAKNPLIQRMIITSLLSLGLGFLAGHLSVPEKELSVDIPRNSVAFKPRLTKSASFQGKSFLSKKGQCLISEKAVKTLQAGDESLILMRFSEAGKILQALAKEDMTQVEILPFSLNPPPPCGMLTRVTYGNEGEF